MAAAGFPREPDGKGRDLAKPRFWSARGRDLAGREFEGYLVVETASQGYLRYGYFEWQTKEGGGRYHFEGTFDPETRLVRWSGYSIEQPFGVAARANYEATLSKDGSHFEGGKWSGGISVPGTWTAERHED
jgi:hypothetical protein